MARVRQLTPSVGTRPLDTPGAVRPSNAGTLALAKGLDDLARGASVVAVQQRRDREDALAIDMEELEADFTGRVNRGVAGIEKLEGKNASFASGGFYSQLEKDREEILGQVQDERASRILATRFKKLEDAARLKVEQHVDKQGDVADDLGFAGLKAEVVARVATDATSPALRAEAVQQLVPHIRRRAAKKGLDADVLERAWRSEATEIVMTRLISKGAYAQARELLADPATQELLGEKISKYEGDLTKDERDAEGARQAREIVTGFTNGEGNFERLQAQSALDVLLASDVAPEVKKAAAAEFDAAAARAERGFNARLNDVADQALTKIVQAGGSLLAAGDEKRWLLKDEVNGGKLWQAIVDQANARLREGEPETKAQREAMVDFLVALPGNVQTYAATPVKFKEEWYGKLSPKDLERAASLVAVQGIAARKPDESLPTSVLGGLAALGDKAGKWGKAGPKSPEQKELYYQIYRELIEKQGELKAAGVPPAKQQEELLNHAKNRLREVRVVGSGIVRDDRTTAIEAESMPGYANLVAIPTEEEKRYREKLQKRGLPTGDDFLVWLYRAEQGVPDAYNPMPARPPAPTGPGGMTPAQGEAYRRRLTGEEPDTSSTRSR